MNATWHEASLGLHKQLERIIREVVSEVLADAETRVICMGLLTSDYDEDGLVTLRKDIRITKWNSETPPCGESIIIDHKTARYVQGMFRLVDQQYTTFLGESVS